jgi:hypothetical protein
MSIAERPGANLAEPTRRLHRLLLDGLLATGAVTAPATLAAQSDLPPAEVAWRLRELAAGDYLALDEASEIVCLYPLSPRPTAHVAVIAGERRYAMCAIDLLGIPAMVGRDLDLEARCVACDRAIRLRVRPGAVIRRRRGSSPGGTRWRRRSSPAARSRSSPADRATPSRWWRGLPAPRCCRWTSRSATPRRFSAIC